MLKVWTYLRGHPRLVLAAVVVATVAGVVGVWVYAHFQVQAARRALADDRVAEARERLRFPLLIWWRDTDVHLLAARAARLAGDLSAAEYHLNRSLELSDSDEVKDRVQVEFALIRVQTGEVDDLAQSLFDKVDMLEEKQHGHPESGAIMQAVANAYLQRLRYKPAFQCLSRWIESQPNNPKPYQWRGWTLERLNNPKRAMEDYQRALELDPNLIPVRLRIAEMYLEDKQAPDALPHLEHLIRQAPDNSQVRARLGMCRFHQGRAKEARELMESALNDLPRDPALLVCLANLDLQEGVRDAEMRRILDAERRLRTVLESDPSDTEALFVLVPVLQAQNRNEEAAKVLAEFTRKRAIVDRINDLLKDVADSPNARPNDYAEIGELFFQIDRGKFGTYWSERALEGDPENQRAHAALAAYYEKQGDAVKASDHQRHLRKEKR